MTAMAAAVHSRYELIRIANLGVVCATKRLPQIYHLLVHTDTQWFTLVLPDEHVLTIDHGLIGGSAARP